eukprot:350337-Chlamydomonas_euryale.AAC.11
MASCCAKDPPCSNWNKVQAVAKPFAVVTLQLDPRLAAAAGLVASSLRAVMWRMWTGLWVRCVDWALGAMCGLGFGCD